jgi:hypothetical protein
MANQKVPQLPVLTAVTGEDLFYVVDVSDTTDDPTGSSKQITRDDILTNVNQIDFNVTATTTPQIGRLRWNDADEVGTLELDLKGGNVSLQVGEESLVRVYNADSVTLTAGTVVYVFGNQGNTLSVKRASASGETSSSRTLGVVRESIAVNDRGFVSTGGLVYNTNTSAYSGGTPLWLSVIPGQVTNVKPIAPDNLVLIGFVARVSSTVGSIFVHISNGFELDELHDVRISGKTNGDLIAYNSGTTVWENTKTLNGDYRVNGTLSATTVSATTVSATTYYGSGTNLTGVVKGSGTTNYLPKWTGTTGLGNSQIQDDGTSVGIGISPSSTHKLKVYSTLTAIYGESQGGTNNYGVIGSNLGDITGTYVGIYGFGSAADTSYVDSIYVGGKFLADGSQNNLNYAGWFVDGTEGLNKVLISATADGKSNWSSDLTGLTSVRSTTISASTYQNLPIDIRVTGGTYSAGTATFMNNTGGTFTVSGFSNISASNYVVQGRLNADQSVPTNADTTIQFIDDFDPQNWWNASTYRFTPTIAGYYLIDVGVWWSAFTTTTGQCNIQARKNGNTFMILQTPQHTDSGNSVTGTKLVYMDGVTDYIEFTAYHNNGTNLNLQYGSANGQGTWFSAFLLDVGISSLFSGGTINSATFFNNGLSANTFSITTTPTNNDSPTQVITRNETTGQLESTSPQSPGLFNYGLANAIMTGNFLT